MQGPTLEILRTFERRATVSPYRAAPAACTARVNKPASTTLDGSSTGRVLDLYTTDKGDVGCGQIHLQEWLYTLRRWWDLCRL